MIRIVAGLEIIDDRAAEGDDLGCGEFVDVVVRIFFPHRLKTCQASTMDTHLFCFECAALSASVRRSM